MPVWNEAGQVQAALEAAWGAGADEVIVVDGGSRDRSVDLALAGRCRLLQTSPGRAHQQNAGAQVASGEVLLFLHADNRLPRDGVRQIREACRSPAVQFGAFRQAIAAPGTAFRALEWGNAARVRWRGIPFGDQAIFVRRATFFQVGGFPDVPLLEDVILSQSLRALAWPVLLPGPLQVNPRRWQKHGVIRQTLRNWRILISFACGATPDSLARLYPRHDPEF